MEYRVTTPTADVYGEPDKNALRGKYSTQLVQGEIFIVEQEKDGWSKGVCAHDQYPGFVESARLGLNRPPTHIVNAARSHTYRDSTIKSPVIETLSFGSRIEIIAENNNFCQTAEGAWVYHKHITPIDAPERDYVATAKKFLETPYYWGGRSGFGIDCSGLVQVCLARAGIKTERDTDQQIDTIGAPAQEPFTGDIIFFKGHVGIMADEHNLIHANATHMKVTIEPLSVVGERSGGITAIRRIF